MLKCFFPVKLFILNTATVTDITTDHNFHGRTDVKTFTYAQRSRTSLAHSVGRWGTLGLKGLSGSQVLHLCFLIPDAVRGVSKKPGRDTLYAGKGNKLGFFMGIA